MAVITPTEFKARFPEFDSESDARIQAAIDDTKCNFNISRWGCHYPRAHSLYVAHIITTDNQRRAAGSGGASPTLQATSKSADSVSVSYNAFTSMSSGESFLQSTNYGQEYLLLKQQVRTPGAFVANGCQ